MGYTKLYSLKSHDYMLDHREDELVWEYHEVSITVATNEATVEVPTSLDEVLGLVDLHVVTLADDPTDSVSTLTDGVITTGAVTVEQKSLDVADGARTIRFFFVGKLTRKDQ